MPSTGPEKRRTRTQGASPGGFRSLDLNAPTRRRNASKATVASTAPDQTSSATTFQTSSATTTQTSSTILRIPNKRKNEDEFEAEDRPVKKTRTTKIPKTSKTSRASRSTMSRTKNTQGSTGVNGANDTMTSENLQAEHNNVSDDQLHFSQEERLEEGTSDDAMLETDQELENHLQKQQPTPPAEHETTASKKLSPAKRRQSRLQEAEVPTPAKQAVLKTPLNDNFLANMLEVNRRSVEGYEPEKPLSECDDDEFAARLPGFLAQARQTDIPKRGSNPSNILGYWMREGRQAVWLRERASAPRQKGSPSEHNLLKPPSAQFYQGLSSMERRELTSMPVIDAISAGIDWLEKNRGESIPTPAEMNSLLDDFKRSKELSLQTSQAIKAPESPPAAAASNPISVQPITPRKDSVGGSSDTDTDTSEVEGEEEHVEANSQGPMLIEEAAVVLAAPQTPPRQEPSTGRGWAAALSTNLITNVLRTPGNWFARRGRAHQDAPVTEPRPAKKQMSPNRSAQPDKKAKTPAPVTTHGKARLMKSRTTFTGNRIKPSKTPSSQRGHDLIAPPATPTPTSRQPRRGRPDSHLPVHLRGVLYEDLPPEYQAISQHMKKERPIQEDNEEEEVDIPAMLALAAKTRRERDLKEAQEKALRLSQQASVSEDVEIISQDRAGMKRKRIVKVKQPKKFIANLAPGTYGLPVNIDDSSSEEEVDMEVDVSFSSPEGQRRRSSLPKKSNLRRSLKQTGRSEHEESDEDYDAESRPSKKQRITDHSNGQATEEKEDAPDPLKNRNLFTRQTSYKGRETRFTTFLDMPPRESAKLRKEAREYVEMQPRAGEPLILDEDIQDPELAKTVALFKKIDQQAADDKARIEAEQSLTFGSGAKPSTTGRALQEIQDNQVNKVREKIQKYTPKNPSSLRNVKVMSPIAERNESPLPEWAPGITDPEVIAAILAIPEEDIIAMDFGPPPPDLFPQFSALLDSAGGAQAK